MFVNTEGHSFFVHQWFFVLDNVLMYIHYVYNASLCVVYFISCITLCYCCTPTLNILIKLARDIILYFFLAYNTYISLFNIPPPPYQWDELRMLYSIIKLGTYPSKNSPKSSFPTLPPFLGTHRYVYLLPGAPDTRDPLKFNDSTPIDNTSMPELHISDIHRSYLTFSYLTSSLLLFA